MKIQRYISFDISDIQDTNFEITYSLKRIDVWEVFINVSVDKQLSPKDQIYLEDGDTIQMGKTKLVLKTKALSGSVQQASRTVINTI